MEVREMTRPATDPDARVPVLLWGDAPLPEGIEANTAVAGVGAR